MRHLRSTAKYSLAAAGPSVRAARLRGGNGATTVFRHMGKHPLLYLMLLPAIVWFVVFRYLPMYGVLISFKDYNMFAGVFRSPWIGFAHFERLFTSEYFFTILRYSSNSF